MNIKTRYFITNCGSWSILVLMSLFLWLAIRETKEAIKQNESADQIIQTISKLKFVAVEYLLYREKRPAQQWQKIYDSLTPQLAAAAAAAAAADSPDSKKKFFLKRILENSRNTRILFFNLRLAQGDSEGAEAKKQLLEEFNARTTSQMMANLQLITDDAIQIGKMSHQQVKIAQERVSGVILFCTFLLGAILTINSVFIRRSILRPLLKLKRATEGFASGELENIVDINTRDEVGDLSRSFNSMRIKLKEEFEQRQKVEVQKQKSFEELKESQAATLNIMEDLKESEDRFRIIVEGVKDYAIFLLDVNGIIMTWNLGAERIKGYKADEIIGQHFSKFYSQEDIASGKPMRELQIAIKEGVYQEEGLRLRKDGSQFWANVLITALRDPDGNLKGFSKITRDITVFKKEVEHRKEVERALRESENLYRSLFNSIDEGFCIVQMIFDDLKKPIDFQYLQVNPSFEKQSGLKDVQGKRIRELVPQLESDWFEIFGKIAVTGEPARFENRAEQLSRWYDVYAFRFGNPENRQVAILFNDITERNQAKEKLAQSHKELESKNAELKQLDILKNEFVNNVSHELRTPLTVIKEIVALMYDETVGAISPKQKDLLETAKSSVDRLARMIDNALDYQKLEAQKVEYNVAEWNINDAVKIVGEGFNLLFKNRGLHLEYHLQTDLPMIKFDNDKIVQVLTNLINNAMKFTPQGSIYLITQKEGDNAIRVSIKDEGIGVKEENLDKLFQAFSQISSKEGYQVGGTGLGLALCKKIIEGHKGKIGVDSKFGQGSTFYFILPIQERRIRA